MLTITAFYYFFDFPQYRECREPLRALMLQEKVKGTILLAHEGFNGTICGPEAGVNAVVAHLSNIAGTTLEEKRSTAEDYVFQRTKVRLKKEIITFGLPAPLENTGLYADAATWNALLADPETIVLDTRNEYEVEHGTFERAINPHIESFTELPAFVEKHFDPKKHKKIATFCTGGIRCEKFTAWMNSQGSEEVWQLKGGILQYLKDTKPENSKWQGECFVFDDRVAVSGEQIAE